MDVLVESTSNMSIYTRVDQSTMAGRYFVLKNSIPVSDAFESKQDAIAWVMQNKVNPYVDSHVAHGRIFRWTSTDEEKCNILGYSIGMLP